LLSRQNFFLILQKITLCMGIIDDILTNAQNLIAFFAFIVALCSFVLTVATLHWQRKHDRLMILPLPNSNAINLGCELALILKNDGIGPLVIKSVKFTLDKIEENPNWIDWPPTYDVVQKNDNITVRYTDFPENVTIIQEKSVRLLFCEIDPAPEHKELRTELNKIRRDLRKIKGIRIEYSDVYAKNKDPKSWIYRLTGESPWETLIKEIAEDSWDDIKPDEDRCFQPGSFSEDSKE